LDTVVFDYIQFPSCLTRTFPIFFFCKTDSNVIVTLPKTQKRGEKKHRETCWTEAGVRQAIGNIMNTRVCIKLCTEVMYIRHMIFDWRQCDWLEFCGFPRFLQIDIEMVFWKNVASPF